MHLQQIITQLFNILLTVCAIIELDSKKLLIQPHLYNLSFSLMKEIGIVDLKKTPLKYIGLQITVSKHLFNKLIYNDLLCF